MNEVAEFVVGFPERHSIGFCFQAAGQTGMIVQEITRKEMVETLARFQASPEHTSRVGGYHFETREFIPSPIIPDTMRFFYRCTPISNK